MTETLIVILTFKVIYRFNSTVDKDKIQRIEQRNLVNKWNYNTSLPTGRVLEALHKRMASVLTLNCLAIGYYYYYYYFAMYLICRDWFTT